MTSYTPNLDLAKQDTGAQNWGIVLNENFDKIDAGVAGKENKITAENAGDNIFIETEKEISATGEDSLEISLKSPSDVSYIKALGKCSQALTPTASSPLDILCNNGVLRVRDSELPAGYQRIESITGDGDVYYNTGEKLYGSDVIGMTVTPGTTSGQILFGAYSGTSAGTQNYSLYIYGSNSSDCYFRYGTQLYRPTLGTGKRTITFGAPATT